MATELQITDSVSAPLGALDAHLLVILGIILLAGLLGGLANAYLSERKKDDGKHEIKHLVFGVVAAFTVPLFLNMISSTLLETARIKPVDFFAFAGFCLFYVVASRRLFEQMVQKLSGEQAQSEGLMRNREDALDQPSPPSDNESEEIPVLAANEQLALGFVDVEILRVLSEESVVCGNLTVFCNKTAQPREIINQHLNALKNMGFIETRINDKNIAHWGLSSKGKTALLDIRAESMVEKIE